MRSNHVDLSSTALQFLTGELLGDGCLHRPSRLSARYVHGSKHKAYLQWLSTSLSSFGIRQIGKIQQIVGSNHVVKAYTSYLYTSAHYVELLPLWRKWYRRATEEEKGRRSIKIVPKDLKLTSLTCRQWYLGDGCLVKDSSDYIKMATCGFTDPEVSFLIEKLKELDLRVTRYKSKDLSILTRSTKAFLDYIGPCPTQIEGVYGYKWDYRARRKYRRKEAKSMSDWEEMIDDLGKAVKPIIDKIKAQGKAVKPIIDQIKALHKAIQPLIDQIGEAGEDQE